MSKPYFIITIHLYCHPPHRTTTLHTTPSCSRPRLSTSPPLRPSQVGSILSDSPHTITMRKPISFNNVQKQIGKVAFCSPSDRFVALSLSLCMIPPSPSLSVCTSTCLALAFFLCLAISLTLLTLTLHVRMCVSFSLSLPLNSYCVMASGWDLLVVYGNGRTG